MKTKLVRPVLVETNEKNSLLWSYKGRRLYYNQANFNDLDETIYYQLILISLEDEKIEVGDKCFNANNPTDVINNIINIDSNTSCLNANSFKESWKKIIAAQDQLSPEYIAKFVEQYNNGEVNDVEIEVYTMNEGYTDVNDYPYQEINILKLSNGFISIIEKKEPILYTEEEVLQLLYKWSVYKVNIELDKLADELPHILSYDEWFEQNKKK